MWIFLCCLCECLFDFFMIVLVWATVDASEGDLDSLCLNVDPEAFVW